MPRPLLVALFLLFVPQLAAAACGGRDQIAALPEAERAALLARVEDAPFPRGNLWRAERDGQVIHLLGTMHIGNSRMAPMMARAEPLIEAAATVLVEVTPAEEARLQAAITADPSLAFLTAPPTLRDKLADDDWTIYAAEMAARGVPAFLASQYRPWLAFITLAVPACLIDNGTIPPGLDAQVIAHAQAHGVPVAGLEGYEAAIEVFDALDPADAFDILRVGLRTAEQSEDQHATLLEAYFAGEHRLLWEFSRSWLPPAAAELFPPDRLARLFDELEESLLIRRNRAWLPIILDTPGPLLVAVGAAHLSGREGLLDLLDRAGFALQRLDG